MNARAVAFLVCAAYSSAQAGTLTTLHTFTGSPNDGSFPGSNVVIGPGGVLYGTTLYGGEAPFCGTGCGTVFSLTPPASPGGRRTKKTLYQFTGGSDGAYPNGVVARKNSVLYGTTQAGGSSRLGTVFSLTP